MGTEKWTPEAETENFLNQLRDSDSCTEFVDIEVAKPASAPVPEIIASVLESPDRDELISVAKMLGYARVSPKSIIFKTPVGDIQCRYMWSNVRLDEVVNDQMFFVKIRSSDMVFIPKPGAVMEITTDASRPAVAVVCLTAPLSIYPGIDLLCFMPHTSAMQKDGKLKEGAPSVVSGKPSDAVVKGEPVVRGEDIEHEATVKVASTVRDFDQPRP